ncbi:hypothetical protein Tco_1067545 [Tanacetum coccineum]|uniref:Reverse transcriptase domain-containing protein n=1 Tax=Tanacetum coccineum TaxID=301880 RepID=A0ABQ5HDE3_9ASTR
MQQAKIAALRGSDRRRQTQMADTLRVLRDMRREMSDIQAELLAYQEQIMVITRGGPSSESNNMTPEAVQVMIDQSLLRNPLNGGEGQGTEGVVGLTRWIEKMESVFNISGCAIENRVKFATCTLLDAALTW